MEDINNIKIENTETDKDLLNVNLNIMEPKNDEHFMITFNAESTEQAQLFNLATCEVLEKHFGHNSASHRLGVTVTSNNNPGLHGWEILMNSPKINTETLREIVVEIKAHARNLVQN